jgi:hypothetical protein
MNPEKEEKDYCSDCGAEFIGYHYCELARSFDEEQEDEE